MGNCHLECSGKLSSFGNPPAPVPPFPSREPPPLIACLRPLPRECVLLAECLQLLHSLSLDHLHNGLVQQALVVPERKNKRHVDCQWLLSRGCNLKIMAVLF